MASSSTESSEKKKVVPAGAQRLGPDPVLGVGLVILGIFVMGVAGASTAHYAFNVGTGIALLGAVTFLVSVTLSTLRQSQPGS